MNLSHTLPASPFASLSRPDTSPRRAVLPGFEGVPDRLVRWGALLNVGALTAFLILFSFGLLDLDTMTLLPAAACASAAAMSLGVTLACLRALQNS